MTAAAMVDEQIEVISGFLTYEARCSRGRLCKEYLSDRDVYLGVISGPFIDDSL